MRPGATITFRPRSCFPAGDDDPRPAGIVEDVGHLPLQQELHPAARELVQQALDQDPAAVGAHMGLADVEQGHTEPLRPPPVDLQILFLLDGRLQHTLHQGQQPLGLFPGPGVCGKADGIGVVLLAVVQQTAGADSLPVDHQDREGRGVLGDVEGGAETGRTAADDDDVVIEGGHGILLGTALVV